MLFKIYSLKPNSRLHNVWKTSHQLLNSNKMVTISNPTPEIANIEMKNEPVNSLNLSFMVELRKAIQTVEHSKAKGFILSSKCRTYSAGLNLAEMHNAQPEFLDKFWSEFQDLWATLYNTKLATISAINGASLAGGCILSLACDYRIITSIGSIGLNEAAFGLVAPPWSMPMMIDIIGRRQAEKALSLGTKFSSEEALKIGLVDKIVQINPSDDAETIQKLVTNEAVNIMKECIKPPGRAHTKLILRKDHIQLDKAQDTEIFKANVLNPVTQKMLGAYLQSLSKKN